MSELAFVDTHVHFFDLRRRDLVYEWLQPNAVQPELGDINPIKSIVYTSSAFLAESRFANVSKIVHIQAALGAPDPVAETIWLEEMFQQTGCPNSIVACADLKDPNVEETLARHVAASPRVVGIRDFGEGDYLVSSEWQRGYALLEKYNFLCELDCTWPDMGKASDIAKKFPSSTMVLDHAGYPTSRSDEYFRDWKTGMELLAEAENTWCKISGLGMCDHRWTIESLRPWVLAAIETFGVGRCFFGTNWPVDRLYSSYDAVIDAYAEIINDFNATEQEALFSANATRVYRIE